MMYQDIHTILIENSRRFGSKDYIISADQRKHITFEQIENYTAKVANFLKEKGLRKEDRVSLIGKNSIETIIIFLGVMRYGAVLNPINTEESGENIQRIIRRVKPRMIFCDKEVDTSEFGDAEFYMPFAEMETSDTQQFDLFTVINAQSLFFKKPIGSRKDIAEILFTSGTTEQPKGVVISREELFFMVD
jgi:long-subunit acyl-CoA synthetase (AMP-forming)